MLFGQSVPHRLLKTFWTGINGWADETTSRRHGNACGIQPSLCTGNGEEAPFSGHALESVSTAVFELES